MTVENSAASAAELPAMLLETGRHAKFVGEDVLAKPVCVTLAGSLLSGGVRLRRHNARSGNEGNDETKTANHDRFLSKSGEMRAEAR